MNRIVRNATVAAVFCAVVVCALALPAASAVQTPGAREARLIEILKSGASVQEKDQACRELQVIGTPASIPALAGLLADKELSHMARYALEPMPYPQAGQALREALARTTSLVQIGIINSLGFREEKAAVPDLIPLLKSSDIEVAGAAAAALGRIATPEAVLELEQLRAAAAPSLQAIAAEASLTAAERLVRDNRQADAARIYEQLQAARWPLHVRQGAFAGLLAARPEGAVALIVREVEGRDPALKAFAIAHIPSLKTPGATERFASLLPKLPADTQVPLIDALADCEPKAALGALERAAASRRQEVKLAAVGALGKAGDASSVRTLCGFLADTSTEAVKKESLKSLERLRGDGINAELRACFKTSPAGSKVMLISVMTARRATEALPDLLQEARGGDLRVRVAALKTVGNWGGADLLPAALEILTGWKGEEGRTEAELATARLARRIPDRDKQADPVLEALQAATETPVKCSLLRVLGAIANRKSLDAVQAALASGDREIKETALNALVSWPNASAVDLLIREWRSQDDPSEKTSILRGLTGLLRRGELSPAESLVRYKELLDGAGSREDKVLILSGLAEVADPAALALVAPGLADPQVRVEAELCAIQIVRRLIGSAAPAARKTATRLAAEAQNEEVRKEALEIVRRIEQTEDYLMAWQVAGPYSRLKRDEPPLWGAVLPPEAADPSVQWRNLPLRGRAATPWMLDLAGPLGGARMSAAYARTWVYSEKAQDARLELTVDEPVKVWLNGELVHLHNVPVSAAPVKDLVRITMKQGWNLLMLKILQADGPWEFSVKLRDLKGERLEGVQSDADHGR